MNKKVRRLLSLCLTVLMLMVLAVPAFADGETKERSVKQYQSFCCIGDSVAVGMRLTGLTYNDLSGKEGTPQGDGRLPLAHYGIYDKAYPGIVRKAIGADYYSMTCVGQQLTDVMWILDAYDDYDYDEHYYYHYVHQNSHQRFNSIMYMRESGKGIEAIRNSSLVVVALGANDIFTYPLNLARTSSGLDVELFLEKVKQGSEHFNTLFPKLLERIRELNPDCTIIVVGQFNPYHNYRFTENDWITAGQFIDGVIESTNNKFKLWASRYDATYVDVTAVGEEFPEVSVLSSDFLARFNSQDNHPTQKGHDIIAQAILNALPDAEKKISLPTGGINRFELGGFNAGNFIVRSNGLGLMITTMDGRYVNVDPQTLQIVLSSSGEPALWHYNGGFYTETEVKTTSYTALFNLPVTNKYKATTYLGFDGEKLIASGSKVNCDLYVAN